MKTFDKSSDAELYLPSEDYESPEQQIAVLETLVSEMHQDLQEKDQTIEELQRAVADMEEAIASGAGGDGGGGEQAAALEARTRQLQATGEQKDHQIARLEDALVATEEALSRRASEAEDWARQLQAVADERERRLAELQAALEASTSPGPAADALANEHQAAAEVNLERALEAEERAMQFQSIVEERGQIVARLESELVRVQREVALQQDADGGQSSATADAEAKAFHLQVLAEAKDKHILQLEHLLRVEQEQKSVRRMESMSHTPPFAPPPAAMMEEREQEVLRLTEDVAEARKRAGIAESSRQDLRRELAASAEEVMRLQVALDGKDVRTVQAVEDEKRMAGAHKQVIEAEVTRLQTFMTEKDHLIEQLMTAVATNGTSQSSTDVKQLTKSFEEEIVQLTKSFEDQRVALREQLVEQGEMERRTLVDEVEQLRREGEVLRADRDAQALELKRAMARYEQLLPSGGNAGGDAAGAGPPRVREASVLLPAARGEAAEIQMLPRLQTSRVTASYVAAQPILRPGAPEEMASPPQPVHYAPRASVAATAQQVPFMLAHDGGSALVPQRTGSPVQVRRAASPTRHQARAASPTRQQQSRAVSPARYQQRVSSPMSPHQRAASPAQRMRTQAPMQQFLHTALPAPHSGLAMAAQPPSQGGSVLMAAGRGGSCSVPATGGSLVAPPPGPAQAAAAQAAAAQAAAVQAVALGYPQGCAPALASPKRPQETPLRWVASPVTARQSDAATARAASPLSVRQAPSLNPSAAPAWTRQSPVDASSKYLLAEGAPIAARPLGADGGDFAAWPKVHVLLPGADPAVDRRERDKRPQQEGEAGL